MLTYSVIIPTYNKGKFVVEAVNSALQQTDKRGEVIVVDDGSTDNTSKLLSPLNDRILYVYQENSERAAARNKGIRLASGDIIFFLDADDLWERNHVEKVLEVFERDKNVGLVYSGAVLIDEKGIELSIINRGRELQGFVLKDVLKTGSVRFVNSSAAVLRMTFDRVGYFNEDILLSGSEDFEMWVRIINRYPIAGTNSITVKYRTYSENTMSNPERMEISMMRALNSLFLNHIDSPDLIRFRNQCYARIHILTAINFYAAGKVTDAIRHLWESLKCYPLVFFYPIYVYTLLRVMLGKRIFQVLRKWKYYKKQEI